MRWLPNPARLKASEAVQHELELQGLSGRDPSPGDELPELEEIPFQSPPRHTREWRSVSSVSIGVQADVRLPPGEVVMSVQQPLYVTKNGQCIHSRKNCSSLPLGGRIEERHLCQLCNR